jgi:anti-sigma factor RsiW
MKFACEHILPLLDAYYDGELDPPARAQVEEHLRTCESCTAELSRIRAASASLRAMRDVEPTPQQMAGFRAAVEEAADDGRTLRTAQTLAVMAASVLIVGLAWLRVLAPTSVTPAGPTVAATPAHPWEYVAMTLLPDPGALPPTGDAVAEADEAFADWMLQGLGERSAEQ